jgi:hypothetical protein
VNFWTYGCVNCVNTLPHVTALYGQIQGPWLTVIGGRNMRSIVGPETARFVCQHEQIDRTLAWLPNAAS